jgi:hypothetical protein
MAERRRAKQQPSLKERLAVFAEEARGKASQLRPGPEREDLLKKARQANTAAHLDAWANSAGLRPPE